MKCDSYIYIFQLSPLKSKVRSTENCVHNDKINNQTTCLLHDKHTKYKTTSEIKYYHIMSGPCKQYVHGRL